MELWAVEFQLVNSAPEFVFEWLKSNPIEKHKYENGNRDRLEHSLLSRNEKLINLGLALYGETPSVGYSLFKSGDQNIKRAALGGRSVSPIFLDESWVFNDDVIPALLEEERKTENNENDDDRVSLLQQLLGNKFLPAEVLVALYKKTGHFSDVDENLWISMVAMSARNDRLSTPYSSTWMDGYDEYRYNAVFSAAWRLFKVFPVSKRAAHVLCYLSDRLVPDCPHDMKALDVVERWRSTDDEDDKAFSLVRTALVKIVGSYSDEFKLLKNHKDFALRKGYYANLKWAKPSDVSDGFNKDGKEFLDSAIYNDTFFSNEETRSALRQACWDAPDEFGRMDYPNLFNSRAEYLCSKHPEWFKNNWSGELPFAGIKDADERLEKRLEYLNIQVSELYKAFLGNKDGYQNFNEFEENTILNDLRLEMRQIGEYLEKVYQKNTFSWGWLAASAVLGFILGKY
ncbi:MAG: hypothetical protein VYA99_10100 [Pseudomonadota bacterium]|nr:hypothetical protein [Pseudomonadota bacterium]